MKKFDFKTDRSKDTILIDTKNWLDNTSNIIQKHKISGGVVTTYITEVLDVNPENENFKNILKIGDVVLLSKTVSNISNYYAYSVGDGHKYHSVPYMQVLGKFKDNVIGLDTLEMLFDKILIKKIEPKYSEYIVTPSDNSMVGEVIKVGTNRFDNKWNSYPLTVKVHDKVLIRDNVTTEIMFNGETYYATEESMVVGIFNGGLDIEHLDIINKYILIKPFIFNSVLNSNMLITPNINYDDLDYSDIYNPNQFIIVYKDKVIDKLKKYDIIYVDNNITNYVYFNRERYNVINTMSEVEAVIK